MFQLYMKLINICDWRWKLVKFAMKAFADWQTMLDGNDSAQTRECLEELTMKYTKEA